MAATANAPRRGNLIADDFDDAHLELSLLTAIAAVTRPSTPVSSPASSASTPQIAIHPTTAVGNNPPPIRISTTAANMASLNSPSYSGPLSMTSKEWVIPPRPKPGRKPATDTPPTKRKAQNRAAQRAFRERRAARVGELEEQLDEQREDHDRVVRELQNRINHLQVETQTLQSRCQWLEAMLEKERQGRGDMSRSDGMMETQMQSNQMDMAHAGQHLQSTPRDITAPGSVIIAEPRPTTQPFSISQIITPPDSADGPLHLTCGACQTTGPCACADDVLQGAGIPIGCGRCTLGSRCECLEESIRASVAADMKRSRPPGSPSSASPEEKRQRCDAGLALETDFTAMFASIAGRSKSTAESATFAPQSQPQIQPLASVEPRDSCGFCKDGTYCVCAESMMASSAMTAPPAPPSQSAAQQTHTPPPSEDDVVPVPMEVTATGAIKLPSFNSLQTSSASRPRRPPSTRPVGGCGPNGPGTCAQCLSDPKSGLFCRSLAANFERNSREQQRQPGGCCGNGGPGGCCKEGNPGADAAAVGAGKTDAATLFASASASASASSSEFGLSLSCAEAYKTLASHRHFDEAADDIGSWLPKLRAMPIPPESMRGGGGPAGGLFLGRSDVSAGRAPIEVEAASIMSVLKGFDVRFGRGE